ncbi:MAG: twin-arginine translocase subunit TatB [Rhodobacteraceae bacterium]|nr:twin-arginine translocase subunit TatB [Paracoccaceae bacterium]
MLDIGWSELLVIGVVALIVVGPKDLPILFRRLGEFTGKMRAMAREFTTAMDRAADEAGMRDVQKSLRDIGNPGKMGLDAMREATRDLGNLKDTEKAAARPNGKPSATRPAAAMPAASGGDGSGESAPPAPTDAANETAGVAPASQDDAKA